MRSADMGHLTDTEQPGLRLIAAPAIRKVLQGNAEEIEQLVARAYQAHHQHQTVNPDSYFLRFPDSDRNRIIALPAAIATDDLQVSGIKWIASYPANLSKGLERASAVIILNNAETGYPFAVMEGAQISAMRTAASAVLGADHCARLGRRVKSVSFVGGGLISRNILNQFCARGWQIGKACCHDLNSEAAAALANHAVDSCGIAAQPGSLEQALDAEIVVFATSAVTPYLPETFQFSPGQTVLNVSLRDLAPQQVLAAQNVFDDVDHCLKAQTSPHLAEILSGGRDFVSGSLTHVIDGAVTLTDSKPVIYSPFGMGILDVALASFVYAKATDQGDSLEVPDFFRL
ncbi:2,3-diaminopropionate biosynthesis protein SbnB [Pseudophaeobacter sp.]|uniref:2,3-diaminopropionate biosynthesis protein SbnB n=1 Tax=Pseudophaeobacter sp. TaxID=1971739 RepID=UPI00329870C3